jgi:hypothetical protein
LQENKIAKNILVYFIKMPPSRTPSRTASRKPSRTTSRNPSVLESVKKVFTRDKQEKPWMGGPPPKSGNKIKDFANSTLYSLRINAAFKGGKSKRRRNQKSANKSRRNRK